jgi:hypothetical protein
MPTIRLFTPCLPRTDMVHFINHMAGIRPAANATVPVMALKALQSRPLWTGHNLDPLLASHGHGTPHEPHGWYPAGS